LCQLDTINIYVPVKGYQYICVS